MGHHPVPQLIGDQVDVLPKLGGFVVGSIQGPMFLAKHVKDSICIKNWERMRED
jgi:hypothetical protein